MDPLRDRPGGVSSWYSIFMPKRTSIRSTPRKAAADPNTISRIMSEMGRKGGLKGGKARAAALTAEERQETARRAARTRWSPPERSQFEEQKRQFQSIPAHVLKNYEGRFVA